MRKWESYQRANRLKSLNHAAQVLLILGLIIGCNLFSMRYFLRWDLAAEGRFALSPETRAYLRDLDQPVRVIVTIPQASPRPEEQLLLRYVTRLLDEYAYASRHQGAFRVTPEFVDIYQDLQRAEILSREFGLDQINALLVVAGDRRKLIAANDILRFQDQKPVAFNGEASLTSAIMEVTQEASPKLFFLQGHQEVTPGDASPQRGLSRLAEELQKRNYTLESLDLTAVERVPEDCAILIIADPQGPLLASELEKIRTYLVDRAGHLLIWSRPGKELGMEALLTEWGIQSPPSSVVEPDPGYREAGGVLLLRNFGEHPITESLIQNQTFVVSGPARPVLPTPPRPPDARLQITPLLATSSKSWLERSTLLPSEARFDPEFDTAGPVPVAVAAERRASSQLGIEVPGGRVAVFGSPDLFANQRVSSIGNVSLFFNTLNWMLDRDRMLAIPPQPIEEYQLSLSESDHLHLLLYFLLVPGLTALTGFLVYWIRQA